MPNYLRPRLSNATVFFTVTLQNRGSTTLVDNIDTLRTAVAQTLSERPVAIDAWVVLPDHMHCMWTLPDSDYSTRWRLIKSRFSSALPCGKRRPSHIARQERGVWQGRFWEHHIRDQTDYDAHLTYCWWNPVKHGLVEHPKDWLFSSVHRDVRFGDGHAEVREITHATEVQA
ncbi:REP-associated tyrosine transposase [Shimia ponticola]|uniref:REP-associated tyrosine transposase n=1 Tax=Shimia ponticola TaxID=2582893 RepID=UPI0011BD49F9|nr:transposase [Shimia ponticola]